MNKVIRVKVIKFQHFLLPLQKQNLRTCCVALKEQLFALLGLWEVLKDKIIYSERYIITCFVHKVQKQTLKDTTVIVP